MKIRPNQLLKSFIFLSLFLSAALTEITHASSPCDEIIALSENVFSGYSSESKNYILEVYNKERSSQPSRESTPLVVEAYSPNWTQQFSKRLSWSRGLAERLKASEDHAVWLQKLGYTLEKRTEDSQDILMPPTQPEIIFSRANDFVKKAIARGDLNEADAIYLAIPFESVKRKYTLPISLTERPTGDLFFVRPGIDPIPSNTDYKINFDLPQLTAKVWEQTLAEGKMPISLGKFLDHDLGHYTEYLSNISIMKATRNFYRKAVARSDKWREATSSRALWGQYPQAHFFMMRALFFAEAFAVPNLKKSEQIKKALPHLFEKEELSDLLSEKQRLATLPLSQLLTETENFLANYDQLILRQGGSSRDSFNYVRLAPDKSNEYFVRYSATTGIDKVKPLNDPIRTITTENLLNDQYLIAEIVRQLKAESEYNSGDVKMLTNYHELLVDRLARAEIAFANGIKLKITPAQIIRDSGDVVTDPKSLTSRWLSTYVIPNSYLWNSFLSYQSQVNSEVGLFTTE